MRAYTIGLVGDCARVLRRLTEHLAHLSPMRPERLAMSRAVKEKVAADLAVLAPQLGYLRAIRDVLPDHGVVIDELTQVGYSGRAAYEARAPRTYISSGYQGTLGWGVAPRSGPSTRSAMCRWWRSPATAASCSTCRSLRPRCATASRS